MFFDGWSALGRTLLAGVLAYPALVLILRVSGKRTLAKMNAFDLVVTVALGSTLASILTSQSLPLASGLAALLLLVVLQFLVAWTAVRSERIEALVKSSPALLVYRGSVRGEAMRHARISRQEVLAALRSSGLAAISQAGAVVLEADGSLSVLPLAAMEQQPLEGLDPQP